MPLHFLEAKLPTSNVIRRYSNLRAVSLHLVEINKAYAKLKTTLHPVKAGKVIDVSPGKKDDRPSTKIPFSKAAAERISKNSKLMSTLNDQYSSLSNMILNLNTQFKSTDIDPKLVESLTKTISGLREQIRKSLAEALQTAATTAGQYSSKSTVTYVKKVTNFLNKKFNSTGKVTASSGVHAKEPTITYFITYENIKNDKGEIDPMLTVAISESKGHHWINPNMVHAKLVGNFPLGFQLADDEKTAFRQIERYIQEQMILDAQLSVINPKMIPIKPEQVNWDKSIVQNYKFDEKANVIYVNLVSSIKKLSDAEKAAQEIYKKLHTVMVADRPRTRDRIVYQPVKKSKNWQVIYRFTTGDKYTGRTMTNDEHDKLSSMFDDEVLKVFKKALNEMSE